MRKIIVNIGFIIVFLTNFGCIANNQDAVENCIKNVSLNKLGDTIIVRIDFKEKTKEIDAYWWKKEFPKALYDVAEKESITIQAGIGKDWNVIIDLKKVHKTTLDPDISTIILCIKYLNRHSYAYEYINVHIASKI
jgi:hypothetical protein